MSKREKVFAARKGALGAEISPAGEQDPELQVKHYGGGWWSVTDRHGRLQARGLREAQALDFIKQGGL